MKYVVDDKKLNAATFIAFVNQVWQGSYDVEKTQGALSKTINITAYDNELLVGCAPKYSIVGVLSFASCRSLLPTPCF